MLSDPKKAVLYLDQLGKEASSENFQATDEVKDLMRQASLVSLWFFLKFVAGFAGPFDKLNRFVNIGWKGALEYKIVDDDALILGTCASSVGAN